MFAVEIITMPVGSEVEIAPALTAFSQRPGADLVAIPDSFTREHLQRIISVCAQTRLPALYANLVATPDGGLLAYAACSTVQRLMSTAFSEGQSPASFQSNNRLNSNCRSISKTAKALGLDIPATLITRADEVIE
jgi:putative tryptophan/tyrosine transport system substrate-binding protein